MGSCWCDIIGTFGSGIFTCAVFDVGMRSSGADVCKVLKVDIRKIAVHIQMLQMGILVTASAMH